MSLISFFVVVFFFFKQKTAYEMRISDWSSDVCSSDLPDLRVGLTLTDRDLGCTALGGVAPRQDDLRARARQSQRRFQTQPPCCSGDDGELAGLIGNIASGPSRHSCYLHRELRRSEEHTSELQSLMRISYAVFCL